MRFPLGINDAEGVHAKPFHEAEAARNRAIGHDPHDHVHRLRAQADEVPEIVMRGLRLRKTTIGGWLCGVDQVGKLDRILNEEHGNVVTDKVPIALAGVEFRREATHVARQIGRPLVAGNGREPCEGGGLYTDFVEDCGTRIFGDGLLELKMAMHPITARMDHALGNAFVIEVKDLLTRNMVFKQLRPACPRAQPVLVVGDGMSLCRGHHIVVAQWFLMIGSTFGQLEFLGHECLLHLGVSAASPRPLHCLRVPRAFVPPPTGKAT